MSTFTQKHYEAVAALLRTKRAETWLDDPVMNSGYVPDDGGAMLEGITWAFADLFAEDNERFDRAKFERACGFPEVAR